jgi:hypothetical protein
MLVPRELSIEPASSLTDLSDEELRQAIAVLKAMIAEDNAKVINGECVSIDVARNATQAPESNARRGNRGERGECEP